MPPTRPSNTPSPSRPSQLVRSSARVARRTAPRAKHSLSAGAGSRPRTGYSARPADTDALGLRPAGVAAGPGCTGERGTGARPVTVVP